MTEEEITEIIDRVVTTTVLKLKVTGLMRDGRKTAFQKTEELLRNYENFKESDQPYAKKLVDIIDRSLDRISDNEYFEIIPMTYFKKYGREYIAEYFDTTVTTISRNKTKLINELKVMLFSDDVIHEIFL